MDRWYDINAVSKYARRYACEYDGELLFDFIEDKFVIQHFIVLLYFTYKIIKRNYIRISRTASSLSYVHVDGN